MKDLEAVDEILDTLQLFSQSVIEKNLMSKVFVAVYIDWPKEYVMVRLQCIESDVLLP